MERRPHEVAYCLGQRAGLCFSFLQSRPALCKLKFEEGACFISLLPERASLRGFLAKSFPSTNPSLVLLQRISPAPWDRTRCPLVHSVNGPLAEGFISPPQPVQRTSFLPRIPWPAFHFAGNFGFTRISKINCRTRVLSTSHAFFFLE